ncbi:MAG: asparagine synthase (glutamine-hydrolyzing) [Paludibacteraceae bacterium]|nr:asparagine synthase (glutamine-hydrolyzing) [Paludibacteraceae bacterium]MBQ6984050.1 asparagine synthase (glutamine-hydrolyzing) [Paludibacteraceae bacterium]
MCGIVGIVRFEDKPIKKDELQTMMQVIKHRGPDDDGMFIDAHVGLGHVRLSILDLSSAGKQPMTDPTRRYTIIQNGESYNYIELREELESMGYTFKTKTDTEVVLNGYIAWGEKVLDRLNGMFAMAIYDKQEQTLFIARDRFGVKPLYYHVGEGQLIFASEIPAILKALPGKPKANENAIFDYLVFNRTDQTEDTFFEGIFKLQHGCCMTLKISGLGVSGLVVSGKEDLPIRKWYDLTQKVKDLRFKIADLGIEEAKAKYMELFKRAIELRLRADVPWGVCLSGGIDSSAITATIIRELKEPDVHSFSAVYGKDNKADESKFIDEFKGIVPNMHYIHPDAETLFAHLDDYVRIQGEPTPTTSPYALYCILTEASKYVKVILDGQGSDEAIAGYEYIPGLYYKSLFTHFKWCRLAKEIVQYAKLHKSWRHVKYMTFFMLPSKMRTKVRVAQRGYIDPEFVAKHKDSVIADKLYGANTMEEMLIAHFEYKLEHLTKWGDRDTMAFGVEGRSPFLDKDLVEYSIALKDELKIKGGYTKFILREVMKGIMPEKVRLRVDKKGFSVPQDEWFRTEQFQELVREILQSESFAKRGYFKPEEAMKLYQRHLAGEINISKDIWKWINLELWFRKYID